MSGRPWCFCAGDLPVEAAIDKELFKRLGLRPKVAHTAHRRGRVIGALAFGSMRGNGPGRLRCWRARRGADSSARCWRAGHGPTARAALENVRLQARLAREPVLPGARLE